MQPLRVLIFGIDSPIGLAMIRELRDHGVEVYGVGYSKRAIGLYSNALTKGYIYQGPPQQRAIFAHEITKQHHIPYLLTVSEADISFFNTHRDVFTKVQLLLPEPTAFNTVLNKAKTYEIARKIGISTPQSYQIQFLSELSELAPKLSFPVILKWANPLEVTAKLQQASISIEKAEYCYTLQDLLNKMGRYQHIGAFPLIQTFHPGVGLGHMIFMHNSQPLIQFQHLRLHEWPPEGGTSTLCKSLPQNSNPELMEKSIQLLQKIGWEGAAMVEYRHDPDSGSSVLMEINGRFWGSLPLAYYAGAPFVWFTLLVLGTNKKPEKVTYTADIHCLYAIPELKRLFLILFRSNLIMNKALSFDKLNTIINFLIQPLKPKTHYYLFSWRDPKPALIDGYYVLAKAISAVKTRLVCR